MPDFERTYDARWADMDPNQHMRHSAYNDYAAQVRVHAFAEFGLPIEEIARRGLGPVLFREETRFRREVRLLDRIRVTMAVRALRKNGGRFTILHEVFRGDGVHAASILVEGAWLDLERRKLGTPFPELRQTMESFPRTEEFEWLEKGGSRA